jgi:hypothetical protein
MKKLLTIIGILLVCVSTNAQSTLVIDQSIVQSAPYRVGDTITMKYTIAKNGLKPRYFWLRYDFNNKALEYVSNTTVFSQGAVAQT